MREKKPLRSPFLFVLAHTLILQQDSVHVMDIKDEEGDGPSRCNRDGASSQAKRKMKSPSQLEALEKAYSVSSTLSEQARQKLAQQTSLSSREISMWFANKRFQGKQAIFHSEMKREDAHPFTVHSLPSGSRARSRPEAFCQMDSSRNEVLIGDKSTNLSVQSRVLQVIPQHYTSQYALDPLMLTYVEKKLGGPLRMDGPFVGIDFDPLPPGAFGAPFCNGSETMRMLEQPTQIPKSISFLNLNSVSNKTIFQLIDSSHLQNSHRRTLADEFDFTVHPDSVYNLWSKSSCFPSGMLNPQTEDMHTDCDLQVDAQFVSHPVNAIVDKFVVTDTLVNDVTSQVERLHKSEEAQTANKDEAVDISVACKKNCIKRKREVHNHEGQKGEEAVFHEKQCNENWQHVKQPGGCKKCLKKGNFGEKASVPAEVDNRTFKAHGNVQRNLQLIDDEQLELMKIAASRKGLSSIDFLDKDTLDKLHTFQDMLGTFPPKSVIMKQAFAVPPWTECEENVGNLLMVWKFLVTFAGDFGLWPFTLEEFAQAFHDHDSRLLGEIHVALLKFIIRDLEDIKITGSYVPHVSEDNADNPGRTCFDIVDGAYAWGFDINFWKKKLNFLTWPEILRQFALSAGYGPKLNKKAGNANHCGDEGVNDGDEVASFDNHDTGGISSDVQEKEKSSSCDSSQQLTPGTLEFAVFHTLFLVGSRGLTSVEVADYIMEHGLYDLSSMESAHASITNIMLGYDFFLESAGFLRYRLKSCFQKDHSIAEKIFAGSTENIHLCKNSLSGLKVSDRKFQDLGVTGENGCKLNSNNVSTFLSNHRQNVHCKAGLINKSRFQNVDRVSSVIRGCAEDEIILSTRNEEFFDSIHELDSASGEIKSSELFSESWVQELTEEEYSSLSIEERLKILVALVGVITDGNLFHSFIEERLKEAQASKKMMWAKVRLNRRLQEERLNADPIYFSKQVLRHSNISNASTQKEDFDKHFCFSSNCILYEQCEHTPAVSFSELEAYIDWKVDMLHSYKFLPLGKDRRHNKYWQFSTSSSRNDSGTGRIFFESKDGFWKVIDSDEAFDAILSALDTHGIRESHLYFMLKCIEKTFKATTRSKNRDFFAKSAIERQATIVPDCCTDSAISISVTASDTLQSSASLNIDLVKNEKESSSSEKYLHFMKWMWQECFNPDLICAMRYGTKRCLQLLETCYICFQSYLAEERHCTNCHVTFDICNNAYENFSAHLAICEANLKIRLSIPFSPINIQLLKAQLAIIEASIPMEVFHPFWNASYRKSWGTKLKLSSSAKEIFQNLTLLEGAIMPGFLCSDFVTTSELLRFEKKILLGTPTFSDPVPVIPWIPDTSAAVALRLLDLDASIPYMLQHGPEPLEGTEVGEFLVLPRSKAVNHAHLVESAVSEDDADRNIAYGAGKDKCTGMEHRILRKQISILEDFTDGRHSSEVDIINESSGSLRGAQTPSVSSYETNAGLANMRTEAEVWNGEDDSKTGDEFGGGEAVESNECHRWQETVDDSHLGSEKYVDEQQSEAGYLKDKVINEKGFIKNTVGEGHSFS